MKGYDVVTSDGRRIGRVVETLDRHLVVETGRLWRSRRVLPKEFAHADDGRRQVVITVPQSVLADAPRAGRNGAFDVEEAARHYGLAEGQREDPAWTDDEIDETPESGPPAERRDG